MKGCYFYFWNQQLDFKNSKALTPEIVLLKYFPLKGTNTRLDKRFRARTRALSSSGIFRVKWHLRNKTSLLSLE